MKQIPLTQSKFAIVDDGDFEWLNRWKWYALRDRHTKSYYAVRNSKRINGKQYRIFMAREILGLKYGNKRQSDHIDHSTLDNSRSNLRIVTHQKNQFNQKNTKGYYWHKAVRKYHAHIGLNGKRIYLGLFNTAEEARSAYLKAKKLYHRIGA